MSIRAVWSINLWANTSNSGLFTVSAGDCTDGNGLDGVSLVILPDGLDGLLKVAAVLFCGLFVPISTKISYFVCARKISSSASGWVFDFSAASRNSASFAGKVPATPSGRPDCGWVFVSALAVCCGCVSSGNKSAGKPDSDDVLFVSVLKTGSISESVFCAGIAFSELEEISEKFFSVFSTSSCEPNNLFSVCVETHFLRCSSSSLCASVEEIGFFWCDK